MNNVFSATDHSLRAAAMSGDTAARVVAHISGSIYASYLRGESKLNLSFTTSESAVEHIEEIRRQLQDRYGSSLYVELGPARSNSRTIIVRIVFSD